MEKQYFISIYLDKRRPKVNGKYPVKLRIFTPNPRKQKLYSTIFEFSKKEFKSIWETIKTQGEYKNQRDKLREVEKRAENVAQSLTVFSFTEFEKKYLRNTGTGNNVMCQYNQIISRLKSNDRINTVSNYELGLKSITNFVNKKQGKEPAKLNFTDITPEWLQKYENYMINDLHKSRTTVSFYVRTLRTAFNNAINDKEINPDIYPFGKDKYQVPSVSNVKKAFTKVQLKQLFNAVPQTPEQEKAKNFWFFSYACNGMNIKDIALLKHENIKGETIEFYRAKTINTSKTDLRPVTVYLNKFSKSIIKKYGNKNTNKNEYIFSIISDSDNEVIKHSKIKNFTKFINQNLKKLAIKEGMTGDISTYWARHSFATNAIRSGASMEFVSEALSHNNLKTTQNYFAGFESDQKKEIMNKLMKF